MFITIVVCTRDRPAQLARCLATIQPQIDDQSELLVVGSAPSTDQERQMAQAVGARFAYEPRPGLDVARNRGIRQASGEIVAFVDDDVRLADGWLATLRHAFQDTSVACVTGRVLPLALIRPFSSSFVLRFSFDRGPKPSVLPEPTVRSLVSHPPVPFSTGGNMAFRRDLFAQIGLFDEALDAGTPTGGGRSDIFRRLLLAGFTAVYQPDPRLPCPPQHRSGRPPAIFCLRQSV
ncbi:MAG: glycosyltransferase [Chloroflexota bacterium]